MFFSGNTMPIRPTTTRLSHALHAFGLKTTPPDLEISSPTMFNLRAPTTAAVLTEVRLHA